MNHRNIPLTLLLLWSLGYAGFVHSCEIRVFAASSLTTAFEQIASLFEQQHRCHVRLHLAASGVLLQQLRHGAPADVLATADQQTMDAASQVQLINPVSRVNFTRNRLVIIVPLDSAAPANDAAINTPELASLTLDKFRRIAIGNPSSVPAGRYAKSALEKAGVWPAISGKMIPTLHVRQVLEYVRRGEVDAGFTYASDLTNQPVRWLADVETDQPILYPAAVSSNSQTPKVADIFVRFLRSATAQHCLRQQGFSAYSDPKSQ